MRQNYLFQKMKIVTILSLILLRVGGESTERESGLEARIFGGEDVDIRDAASYVLVRVYFEEKKNFNKFCGGNILDEWHVLTAAICLIEGKYRVKEILVTYGNSEYNKGSSLKTNIFAVHPDFNKCSKTKECETFNSMDIAVIILKEPIRLSDKARPVPLPSRKMTRNEIQALTDCSVAGWGLTSNQSGASEHLKRAAVTVNQTACDQAENRQIYDTSVEICVDNIDKADMCAGDTGSGLICGGVIYGLASFSGYSCGEGKYPGVYSRVDVALDFIRKYVRETVDTTSFGGSTTTESSPNNTWKKKKAALSTTPASSAGLMGCILLVIVMSLTVRFAAKV